MSVRVNVDFGDPLGQIDVVNYNFPTCRTKATVSWASIVPNFQILTTSCTSGLGNFTLGGISSVDFGPVVRAFNVEVAEADRSLSVTPLKTPRTALVNGAFGRRGRYAKREALVLDGTGLISIDAGKFSVTSVPIAELDADNDITLPIDVMLVDILSERTSLPSGVYRLRLDQKGFGSDGNISFIEESGKVAVTLKANVEALEDEAEASGFDLVANPVAQEGKVCGKKKCFTWARVGFLHWKFGCVSKETGKGVACAGG